MGRHWKRPPQSVTYVGMVVSDSMKPSAHCSRAAKTANTVLGQLTRVFHYRDKKTFKGLYVQFVRPHLEFASLTWNPWMQKDVNLLKNVQKKAVPMISRIKGQTYEEMLKNSDCRAWWRGEWRRTWCSCTK